VAFKPEHVLQPLLHTLQVLESVS